MGGKKNRVEEVYSKQRIVTRIAIGRADNVKARREGGHWTWGIERWG